MRRRRYMLKASLGLPLLAALILAGCSGSDAAANSQGSGNSSATALVSDANDTQVRTSARETSKGRTMSGSKKCGDTEFERAACMIELILADLRANYRHVYGGGITGIKALGGMSYSIALPQEERTDIFTYQFEVRGSEIAIKSKKESAESY